MPYLLCMLRNKLTHCIPNLHNGVNKRIDAETVEIKIRIRTVVVLDITSTSKLVSFSSLTNHHY
jgi:hypothetical protein